MLSRISPAILLALGFSAEVRAQAIINAGPQVPTYAVIQPLARQMGMAALGTLNERVGNTLSPSIGLDGTPGWWTPPSGWARVMGEHLDNHYRAVTNPEVTGDLLGAQVGVDVWRDRQPSGQGDAVGVYLAYTHSRGDVTSLVTNPNVTAYENEPTGTTRLDGYGGGAYWTHLGAGGWYTDAVFQGTHYSGHASTAHAYLPISGEGYVASLEAGYPFAFELGAPFILEPQAQFVWQHTSFGSKNDGLTEVDLGSSDGVSGRLGVRGQWTIAEDGGSVYQPFLRTNVWRDWSGEVTTTYAGIVQVGSSRVDLQACKLEYSIVSPK